jgi:hypothetical protein
LEPIAVHPKTKLGSVQVCTENILFHFCDCFQTVKALLRSMFNQRADASTGPRAADPAAPAV